MADDCNLVLLQRFCRAEECGALFFICSHCDRGHAYCGDHCRQKSKRKQRREANQRHQQSPEGRLDHRDRQRLYRRRRNPPTKPSIENSVTDAGSTDTSEFGNISWPPSGVHIACRICGRQGVLVNPYEPG
jgi:hypothetical protein